jgi:hypothetical protein
MVASRKILCAELFSVATGPDSYTTDRDSLALLTVVLTSQGAFIGATGLGVLKKGV